MPLRSRPSFFKILLDPSAPHLALPAAFVSKHLKNNIPENPILRSSNGGLSWQLKIKQINEDYCFTDGWINVVKDIQLCYGDFLVFWLVDRSTFNVSIFSPNGCEKELYPELEAADDNHEEEYDADDDVAEGEEEEDDNIVVHKNHVNNNDEEEEEIDDDDDDDDDEEEEEDDVCVEEDDDEVDDEEEDDVDGDIDGNDGDPFFMKVLSKSHQHLMRLPSEFIRLAGLDGGERKITMKNPDDKEWHMSLRSEKKSKRYYLMAGWSQFYQRNKLSEGDECLFKFIKSEDKLCLAKITRKRKAKPVAPKEETKRKRALPPGKEGVEKVVKRQSGRHKSGVVFF